MTTNIIAHFDEYFEMIPATSAELKNEVYKLRYQVYCIENEFLNSEHYPDELEVDDFDRQSIHYLIRHRKSGDYAATTRLILPGTDNPEKLFPLELYCEIDNSGVMQPINREHLGEVSRFCVSKEFKKRKNETHTLAAIGPDQQDYFTSDERRAFPLISLALIACVIKASHENDIRYLYATMERSLLQFLSALGINFIKIGPQGDYHGPRWPTVIKITDLLDCVAEKKPNIWNFLTNEGSFGQTRPIEKPSKAARSNSWVGT
ncbi:PEP-CTERM/exosortase system-associated acyltransferase [Methylobacter sp. G7]|uniref:PEP-CTERM/exosortase system-associated acyltransferase n=1 Tax=Methylobacter sp. G7 TaxID=3230117 RepID=UPI003D808157